MIQIKHRFAGLVLLLTLALTGCGNSHQSSKEVQEIVKVLAANNLNAKIVGRKAGENVLGSNNYETLDVEGKTVFVFVFQSADAATKGATLARGERNGDWEQPVMVAQQGNTLIVVPKSDDAVGNTIQKAMQPLY